MRVTETLKGPVHPEMKVQTLPAHRHADGRSGDVFLVHKTPLEFHRKMALTITIVNGN